MEFILAKLSDTKSIYGSFQNGSSKRMLGLRNDIRNRRVYIAKEGKGVLCIIRVSGSSSTLDYIKITDIVFNSQNTFTLPDEINKTVDSIALRNRVLKIKANVPVEQNVYALLLSGGWSIDSFKFSFSKDGKASFITPVLSRAITFSDPYKF